MDSPVRVVKDQIDQFQEAVELHLARYCESALLDRTRTQIQELVTRLNTQPVVPIALLGTTGAGKSTLINAICGQNVLKTTDGSIGTAAVTTVENSSGDTFRAELLFCTLEEWHGELERCWQILSPELDEDDDADTKALRKEYDKKIRVVYQIPLDQAIDFDKLTLNPDVEELLRQGSHHVEDRSAEGLRSALKKFVTNDGSLWPLVREANISGPFQHLASGIKLVDLPGVNDPNPAREAITRRYLDETPFVVLVFNSKRPITKDVQEFIRNSDLLLRLFLEGKLASMTLVGTHADQLPEDEDELADLGLDGSASVSEIVRVRNERTIATCRTSLCELAGDIIAGTPDPADALSHLGEVLKGVQIFAVASKSFQKNAGQSKAKAVPDLSDSETNIPALRTHLNYLAEGRDTAAHAQAIERKLHIAIGEALRANNGETHSAAKITEQGGGRISHAERTDSSRQAGPGSKFTSPAADVHRRI